MNVYLRRLATLPPAGCLLTPAEGRTLLLTGQSSYATSALSPAQQDFLSSVAPPSAPPLYAGFPFHSRFVEQPFLDVPLLSASARNAAQTLAALTSGRYRALVAERLQAAIDATPGGLRIVTGSCGLHLLNQAFPRLRVSPPASLRVVALGPASFGPNRMPLTVVQSHGDLWSRLFYHGPVHCRDGAGHLDYWLHASVRRFVRSALA